MTKLDIILLYLLGSVFFTLCVYSIVKNFLIALFIAFLLLVFFRTLFIHFYRRRKNKAVINITDMETELSIMGTEQVNFFFSIAPSYYTPVKVENGLIITRKERIYIATNYRFSQTGADDVARFYRFAKKENIGIVWVLGRQPTRQTMSFASSLDILFRFIPSKKVHAFLRDRNALMPKRKVFVTRKKPHFFTLVTAAFTQKRAKYFALSGLCISIYALFGVMRVYYFVLCGICLLCAVVCATRKA